MAKNLMGKSRKPGNGYAVISDPVIGWSWEILKVNQSLAKAAENPYASAFCLVKSPIVPNGEMGDVYLHDIGRGGKAAVLAVLAKVEAELAGKS